MSRRSWRRWLGVVVAIALLAAAGAYVFSHRGELTSLGRLSAAELLLIYLVCLVGTLVSGRMLQLILRGLATPASFADMVLLQNAATVAGLMPFKGGAVLRALYLRRRYGMELARLGLFLLFFAVLTTAVSCFIAAVSLVLTPEASGAGRTPLVLALAVLCVVSFAALLVPVPQRLHERLPWERLRHFLGMRRDFLRQPGAWMELVGLSVAHFLLTALRLGILFRGLDVELSSAGVVAVAALGNAASLLALTPGALGVREIALGGAAAALSIPLEVGLLGGLLERAINLSWAVVVGLPSAYWLLRRLRG